MSIFNSATDCDKEIADYMMYYVGGDDSDEENEFMSLVSQGYKLYGFPFEHRGHAYQALIKFKD